MMRIWSGRQISSRDVDLFGLPIIGEPTDQPAPHGAKDDEPNVPFQSC